jgi:hypothetical protein
MIGKMRFPCKKKVRVRRVLEATREPEGLANDFAKMAFTDFDDNTGKEWSAIDMVDLRYRCTSVSVRFKKHAIPRLYAGASPFGC